MTFVRNGISVALVAYIFFIVYKISGIGETVPISIQSNVGTAAMKAQTIWNKCAENQTSAEWPQILTQIGIFTQKMETSLQYIADELPPNRPKLVHTVGAVARVKWIPIENRYTGLFRSGGDYGIMRFSAARSWNGEYADDSVKGTFAPGFAMKFFRDQRPSSNLFALNKFPPQESWNPFRFMLNSHISHKDVTELAGAAVARKFGQASTWSSFTGTSDFARYDQNGTEFAQVKLPYQVMYAPKKSVQSLFTDRFQKDLPFLLMDIPANHELYDIYALENPLSAAEKIGELVLDGTFTTSLYGDKNLFFKHIPFDEDLAFNPHWAEDCPHAAACDVCPHERDCFKPVTKQAA